MLDLRHGARPFDRFVNITLSRLPKGGCITDGSDGSGAKTIHWAEHAALLANKSNPARAWPYQQCLDGSGHIQTCKADKGCIFSPKYATLAQFEQLCTAMFGATPAMTGRAVAFNNANYGGTEPAGTRILFINGDNDPFSWGSWKQNTTEALSRDVMALVVRGGSHCQDMGPTSEQDSRPMAGVKATKAAWLRRYL